MQIEFDHNMEEKQKKMSQIENEAHLAKVTAQADADFYLMKLSESYQVCGEECGRVEGDIGRV